MTSVARGLLIAAALSLLALKPTAAPPAILSTAPADNEADVLLDVSICITFDTAMNHASAEVAFSVIPVFSGSFSWSGNTLIFTPAGTMVGTTNIQVTIGATAQDLLGNPMGAPYTFSFTTGNVTGTLLPAGVVKNLLHLGADPADHINGQTYHSTEFNYYNDLLQLGGLGHDYAQQPAPGRAAPLNQLSSTASPAPLVWTALADADGTWDDNIGDNYSSYFAIYVIVPTPRKLVLDIHRDDLLTIWMDGNPVPVNDNVATSAPFDVAQGAHIFILKHLEESGVDLFDFRFLDELGADVTDLRYILDDIIPPRLVSVFPTGAGAPIDTDVTIQFNEAMDTTVTASTVAALSGGTATGSWAWTDAYTLVWTPSAPLAPSTLYTVTLTPANAKDARGNALKGTSTATFTTAAISTPAAASVVPSTGGTGQMVTGAVLSGSGFQQGGVVHPPGAVPFGGHFYKFGDWQSWGAARATAQATKGHLVTLQSPAEDAFAYAMGGKSNTWIGMSDIARPGGWQWEDGEPTTYTNWLPGEPNNFAGQNEHQGAYWYAFGWNDIFDGVRRWVGEWEAKSSPTIKLVKAGQADRPGTNVVYNSAGSVTFDVDLAAAATGAWDVVLTNPDGSTTTLVGGFTVTPPPPVVTGVGSTSANGTYTPGDSLDIVVQFNVAVNVTGTPTLTLETGASDAVVAYSGGSGTATLTFHYTVVFGQTSGHLDYVSSSALALNGGTVRDAGLTDAVLTLPNPGAAGSLGANKAIVIAAPPPATVLSLGSPDVDGTYTAGNTLTITVAFSKAVTVTGTPVLTLETGATDATATYASGSGTSTLSFTYAVGATDLSTDLDTVSTGSLSANGGTIRDSLGQDADLTLPVPGGAGSLSQAKNLAVFTPVVPPSPPPVVADLRAGGCGLTGLEVLLVLALLRRRRNGNHSAERA